MSPALSPGLGARGSRGRSKGLSGPLAPEKGLRRLPGVVQPSGRPKVLRQKGAREQSRGSRATSQPHPPTQPHPSAPLRGPPLASISTPPRPASAFSWSGRRQAPRGLPVGAEAPPSVSLPGRNGGAQAASRGSPTQEGSTREEEPGRPPPPVPQPLRGRTADPPILGPTRPRLHRPRHPRPLAVRAQPPNRRRLLSGDYPLPARVPSLGRRLSGAPASHAGRRLPGR